MWNKIICYYFNKTPTWGRVAEVRDAEETGQKAAAVQIQVPPVLKRTVKYPEKDEVHQETGKGIEEIEVTGGLDHGSDIEVTENEVQVPEREISRVQRRKINPIMVT